MERAGVRYLRTSCICIRNRTSERSERVRFLIRQQSTSRGIVFIIYSQPFISNLSRILNCQNMPLHTVTKKTK